MTALHSTRVVVGGGLAPRDVSCEDGLITGTDPAGSQPVARDLGDAIIAPGIVDIQVNGAFGHDFTADPATIWEVAARLPEHGVTAFCPTIITAERGTIDRALDALASRPDGFVGAEPIGLHLEGPMISPVRKGAHPARHIGPVATDRWAAPAVRVVTLAPEVVPRGTISELVDRGIVVAVGHSDADHDTSVAAFDEGARHVTHLFNAMPPFTHRAPGLVGAALADDRVTVAMIPDGVHSHPTTLRLVHRLVGAGRFVAITDAMAAAGMPPGRYPLGERAVETDGESVWLRDGTLAGSVLTSGRSVMRLAEFAGIDLATSLTAHATIPARLLRDATRGEVAVGRRGDLAVFDEAGVVMTLVGGVVVYER